MYPYLNELDGIYLAALGALTGNSGRGPDVIVDVAVDGKGCGVELPVSAGTVDG